MLSKVNLILESAIFSTALLQWEASLAANAHYVWPFVFLTAVVTTYFTLNRKWFGLTGNNHFENILHHLRSNIATEFLVSLLVAAATVVGILPSKDELDQMGIQLK